MVFYLLSATKQLFATPLLQWYLNHGLRITYVHKVLEFIPRATFVKFAEQVTEARRLGDMDEKYKLIGETMKLIGNSR